MYKPGDALIYTNLPGELMNGGIYMVETVGESTVTLMGYETKYPIEDFYPLKDFNGNDDNHVTDAYDRITGRWTLPSDREILQLRGLVKLCTKDRIQTVNISDISGHGLDLPARLLGKTCACCNGERFVTSDMSKPIFLIEGLDDPYLGRRYRNMDGKHRIAKRLYFGYTTVYGYVFHIDEILPYIN